MYQEPQSPSMGVEEVVTRWVKKFPLKYARISQTTGNDQWALIQGNTFVGRTKPIFC